MQTDVSFGNAAAWGETCLWLDLYEYRKNEVLIEKKSDPCATTALSPHVNFLRRTFFQAGDYLLVVFSAFISHM